MDLRTNNDCESGRCEWRQCVGKLGKLISGKTEFTSCYVDEDCPGKQVCRGGLCKERLPLISSLGGLKPGHCYSDENCPAGFKCGYYKKCYNMSDSRYIVESFLHIPCKNEAPEFCAAVTGFERATCRHIEFEFENIQSHVCQLPPPFRVAEGKSCDENGGCSRYATCIRGICYHPFWVTVRERCTSNSSCTFRGYCSDAGGCEEGKWVLKHQSCRMSSECNRDHYRNIIKFVCRRFECSYRRTIPSECDACRFDEFCDFYENCLQVQRHRELNCDGDNWFYWYSAFYCSSTNEKTYNDAKAECEERGATLAFPPDRGTEHSLSPESALLSYLAIRAGWITEGPDEVETTFVDWSKNHEKEKTSRFFCKKVVSRSSIPNNATEYAVQDSVVTGLILSCLNEVRMNLNLPKTVKPVTKFPPAFFFRDLPTLCRVLQSEQFAIYWMLKWSESEIRKKLKQPTEKGTGTGTAVLMDLKRISSSGVRANQMYQIAKTVFTHRTLVNGCLLTVRVSAHQEYLYVRAMGREQSFLPKAFDVSFVLQSVAVLLIRGREHLYRFQRKLLFSFFGLGVCVTRLSYLPTVSGPPFEIVLLSLATVIMAAKSKPYDDSTLSSEDPSTSSASNPAHVESSKRRKLSRKIHIAVAGCSHGEMDKIYATMAEIERREGYKFDLLISCGDYEAVRNCGDLKHMHAPKKYRHLQCFHRYYSGELEAPVLTIFIGGNHEASGYLQELPYGGWVAPKIFYLGHASVVRFAGLRIAGLSGIYNKNDYNMSHWERPPFTNYSAVVSIYHVRSIDMFRLKQLKPRDLNEQPIDIMVTHDWPAGITDYGDVKQLLRLKPYFEEDLKKNTIGNPASMTLLHELKPRYWLAAHLHCFFVALVPHPNKNDPENDFEPTKFLSLDKPLPRRHFLQALEFDVDQDAPLNLSYDPTWLAILRATDGLTSVDRKEMYMPSQHTRGERWDFRPTKEELAEVQQIYGGDFTIPMNFRMTAWPYKSSGADDISQELYYKNPQSAEFCTKLGINDLNEMLCSLTLDGLGTPYYMNKNNSSEGVVGKSKAHKEKDDFDDASDFIIDRNPVGNSLLLENLKTAAFTNTDASKESSSSATDDSGERTGHDGSDEFESAE
uniref:Lariat debranching enzyme C-terminal domain-containing protein n=1 Tax=Setaria digitata TaxID=48799 RepID=A0A915PV11_9BILA